MEFTLFYRGLLKANRGPKEKQDLRRNFHTQLNLLWQQPPLEDCHEFKDISPQSGKISLVYNIGGFNFIPLVSKKIHMIAELDITMLRPEPPGKVIQSGDIDNRIKTLLDGLRMPKVEQELPNGDNPKKGEIPFFCLLKDDNLITRISVNTDRLLENNIDPSEVVLLIHVHTKLTRLIYANIGLG